MLSEIDTCSLEGVPGGFIEATLGFRDGSLPIAATAGAGIGGAGCEGGASFLGVGVWITRSVLGTFFTAGEDALALGLTGTDGTDVACETVRFCLLEVPASAGEAVEAAFVLAA